MSSTFRWQGRATVRCSTASCLGPAEYNIQQYFLGLFLNVDEPSAVCCAYS